MNARLEGIQLERALDSIKLVQRFRTETDDLEELAASMQEHGVLQLPTITPDGVLLIGERRYLAAKQLGWRTMPVWVRSGLSDRLGLLLSKQADHVSQKPLGPLEAAALYRELKTVLAEEAARRQAATQYGAHFENREIPGGGDSPPPENRLGKSRQRAAELITGRDSSQMLERVCRIEDLAADPNASESVRAQAQGELELIRQGGGVNASHLRVHAAMTLDQLDRIAADITESEEVRAHARDEAARVRASDSRAAEMEAVAKAALHRVTTGRTAVSKLKPPPETRSAQTPVLFSARSFLAIWGELENWWLSYDPEQLAVELSAENINLFVRISDGTVAFAHQLQAAHRRITA